LTLTENAGFSPAFIYEAPKGLRLNMNLILKIWFLKDFKEIAFLSMTIYIYLSADAVTSD
jgi:hypothetical protein